MASRGRALPPSIGFVTVGTGVSIELFAPAALPVVIGGALTLGIAFGAVLLTSWLLHHFLGFRYLPGIGALIRWIRHRAQASANYVVNRYKHTLHAASAFILQTPVTLSRLFGATAYALHHHKTWIRHEHYRHIPRVRRGLHHDMIHHHNLQYRTIVRRDRREHRDMVHHHNLQYRTIVRRDKREHRDMVRHHIDQYHTIQARYHAARAYALHLNHRQWHTIVQRDNKIVSQTNHAFRVERSKAHNEAAAARQNAERHARNYTKHYVTETQRANRTRTTRDLDRDLRPEWDATRTETNDVIGQLQDMFPDAARDLSNIPADIPATAPAAVAAVLAVARPTETLARECGLDMCRDLSRFGREWRHLSSDASILAIIAWIAAAYVFPGETARDTNSAITGLLQDLSGDVARMLREFTP